MTLIGLPIVRRRRREFLIRTRRRVEGRRGPRRSSISRSGGATACAYHGSSSFNFGRTRRAVVEKVSGQSAKVAGLVAPKSTSNRCQKCGASRMGRKGSRRIFRHLFAANLVRRVLVVRAARAIRSRPTVGNGVWFGDVSQCVGCRSLLHLRRGDGGVGPAGDVAILAEKGHTCRGLRSHCATLEKPNERTNATNRAYPEPHQVSEVSILWPNGLKRAKEIGKMDPYLRYKGWLLGSCRSVSVCFASPPTRTSWGQTRFVWGGGGADAYGD